MAKGVQEYLQHLAGSQQDRKRLRGASTKDLVKDAQSKGYTVSESEIEKIISSKRGKVKEEELIAQGQSIGWS